MLTALLPVGLKEWARLILVAFIVAAVSYPLGQCEGKRTESAAWALRLEKANRAFQEQKARADALAAEQRLTDTIAVSQIEKDLRDAIADTPDTAPDAVRIQLGCARLRAAGRSPASLPAVCRPGGGAEARPAG